MIVTAALQEDVDVVGPLDPVRRAHDARAAGLRQLRERGLDDVLVTVGGIIPDDDIPALKEAGVAAVFGPGTTIREVADFLRANATPARVAAAMARADRAAARAAAPRRRGQRGRPAGARPPPDRGREPHRGRRARAPAALSARGRRPPRRDHRAAGRRQVHARRGADRELREAGRSVAVVAVDPSSPDHRRRAPRRPRPDAGLRGRRRRVHPLDGVARPCGRPRRDVDRGREPCSTPPGFDIVLLETVGTGQSEVEVAAAADTTVVLEAPEMGDEVQAIKAGLLEVADLVVVNKGDRPGAQRTAAQLRAMLVADGRAQGPRTRTGPRPSVPRCSSRPR